LTNPIGQHLAAVPTSVCKAPRDVTKPTVGVPQNAGSRTFAQTAPERHTGTEP
jgi:hypothetical protein